MFYIVMQMSSCCSEEKLFNEKREDMDRRTFVSKSVKSIIATYGAAIIGLLELSQTQNEQNEIVARFASEADFINFLHYELDSLTINYRNQSSCNRLETETCIHPFKMAYIGGKKLLSTINGICEETEKTTDDIVKVVESGTEYVAEYQQPIDETPYYQREKLECNDEASSVCKKLNRPGVPMYFLSILPHKPEERFDNEWHQMAVCKLDKECYIVIDNNTEATFWIGSLRCFVSQYNPNTKMGIVPKFGISRYHKPKYKNGFSKLLVHASKSIENEDLMECVQIERQDGLFV